MNNTIFLPYSQFLICILTSCYIIIQVKKILIFNYPKVVKNKYYQAHYCKRNSLCWSVSKLPQVRNDKINLSSQTIHQTISYSLIPYTNFSLGNVPFPPIWAYFFLLYTLCQKSFLLELCIHCETYIYRNEK